jgi:hypothetical protein
MSSKGGSFEALTVDAMRNFATSQSAILAKYSDLLARFGKGQVEVNAFNESAMKLAFEGGARSVQDALKFSGAYAEFLSSLTRGAGESGRGKDKSRSRARTTRTKKPSKATT